MANIGSAHVGPNSWRNQNTGEFWSVLPLFSKDEERLQRGLLRNPPSGIDPVTYLALPRVYPSAERRSEGVLLRGDEQVHRDPQRPALSESAVETHDEAILRRQRTAPVLTDILVEHGGDSSVFTLVRESALDSEDHGVARSEQAG